MSAKTLILVLAVLIALPAGLAGCGDDGGTEPTQPPYGTAKTPYGTAKTPYGESPYGAGAGAAPAGISAELQKEVDAALARARELLVAAQDASGGWGDPELGLPANVGYTAMAVSALIAATPSTQVAGDAAIQRGLEFLAKQQKEDGSIWDNPQYVNYMTSAAAGTFGLAKLPAYRRVELQARDFLAGSQIAADESDPSYGGFPYKQDQGQAADLSNLQFAVQALHDAGLPEDHVVWQRVRVYLDHVQNRSEGNDLRVETKIDDQDAVVVSGDDGGAGYGPGMSKAGFLRRADGTYEPRSYGSMTYALLKCLLLSGVDAKDPRVLAALGWITKHFTLERNPGFEAAADPQVEGQQGWYYYVFTLARTLAEFEAVTEKPLAIEDAQGKAHDWRAELARALLDRRRDDGWWVNDASKRWEEGAPVLASSYAVIALAEASGRFR